MEKSQTGDRRLEIDVKYPSQTLYGGGIKKNILSLVGYVGINSISGLCVS